MDEELAVALGPEDRRGDHRAGAEAVFLRRGTIRSSTSRWIAGSRTTPLSVLPLPASNWGLTSATIWPPAGERRRDRAEDLGQRDEGDVDRDERDRLGKAVGRQLPGVGLLHRHDPCVSAKRLGELTATDVDGVDAARTALQEHVGEAASRGSDVEADLTGWIDPERVERGRELVAAAADVWVGRLDGDELSCVEQVARLSVVSCAVALADPDLAR